MASRWTHCLTGHELPILCLDVCTLPSDEWQLVRDSAAAPAPVLPPGAVVRDAEAEADRVIVATGGAGALWWLASLLSFCRVYESLCNSARLPLSGSFRDQRGCRRRQNP